MSSLGAMDPRTLRRGSRKAQLHAIRRWLENRIHESKFIGWRLLEESFAHDLRSVEAELRAIELKAAA